ncbi:hypothetical protein JW796_01685 [Candidatus Dojkabacteria bacterium]|nr:hypothetical protein [Candidatus Dojkabacteria bacterium]
MKTISLQDLKRRGSKAIPNNEVSYLIVNSKPKSAIVPYEEYEALIEAIEELEDIKDYEARKNEKSTDWKKAIEEIEE